MNDDLAAHTELRNLVSAYCVASDRNELETLSRCFTEDGVLAAPTQRLEGRAQIVAGLSGSRNVWRSSFVRHHVTTCWIEVTGHETAIGRSYFLVMTDNGLDRGGVYDDEYQLTDGVWLIKLRSVTLDYVTEDTLLLQPPWRGKKTGS
jgi:SnoaL-like domain